MFLAPIFGSIPPFATGPAIVMVGALMMVSECHCNGGSECHCMVGVMSAIVLVGALMLVSVIVMGVSVIVWWE
jgi:xanthine/uracil/vitamin C permease (AzgA family)